MDEVIETNLDSTTAWWRSVNDFFCYEVGTFIAVKTGSLPPADDPEGWNQRRLAWHEDLEQPNSSESRDRRNNGGGWLFLPSTPKRPPSPTPPFQAPMPDDAATRTSPPP
eukprot:366463-Chlamydomonas_euryale.AAC.1